MSYAEISSKLYRLADHVDDVTSGTGRDHDCKVLAQNMVKNALMTTGFTSESYQKIPERIFCRFEPLSTRRLRAIACAFSKGTQAIADEFKEDIELFNLQYK
ncbi:hypothetical protein [Pseudomonas yamanorum]|uniref:hypothetical protein n=1 Tax=Pseudomonas yamanorum TaxID=515393 RepID=UPI002ED665EF|nr:hypothetical protein VYI69_13430 [Pseudomonas yamanorum]